MDPVLAQVMLWALNFAPQGWASCDGALLPISQYEALFSLIGTTYGGDGQATFALPDLRGRIAVGAGQGPGLPAFVHGQAGGATGHTLTHGQLPGHSHSLAAATGPASSNRPGGLAVAKGGKYGAANTVMAASGATGANMPVDHLPPYLGLNYVICVEGIYPSRA